MNTYRVYVIQLDNNPMHVYVGYTAHSRKKRLAQHNSGLASNKAAKVFKKGARGVLREALYKKYPAVHSRPEGEKLEDKVADDLRKMGYKVEAGYKPNKK